MTNENYVKYTHSGTLEIEGTKIQCFVGLDSQGQIRRVISGRRLTAAIGMKGRGPGARKRIATHRTLGQYLDPKLINIIENPIEIIGGPGSRKTRPTDGYEATVLHDICQALLVMRDKGVLLTETEERYGKYADVLIRGFARVGIIALIDEATGYQAERDRSELHKILEKYIREELRPWVKTFPDEYYKEMFKLRGWQYTPLSVKRPALVGKLTNDIIYERLPPGVLEELRRRNPVNEKGHRSKKHHMLLTENIGVPHLEKLLAGVVALMRASSNWKKFINLLNRAYPPVTPYQPGFQGKGFDDDDDDDE